MELFTVRFNVPRTSTVDKWCIAAETADEAVTVWMNSRRHHLVARGALGADEPIGGLSVSSPVQTLPPVRGDGIPDAALRVGAPLQQLPHVAVDARPRSARPRVRKVGRPSDGPVIPGLFD